MMLTAKLCTPKIQHPQHHTLFREVQIKVCSLGQQYTGREILPYIIIIIIIIMTLLLTVFPLKGGSSSVKIYINIKKK